MPTKVWNWLLNIYILYFIFNLYVFKLLNLEFDIVFLEISMGSTMVWLFLLSLELGLASVEYIVNGNFEYPVLDPNGTSFSAGGWNGSNFNMVNRFEFGASYGQYIDVQNILGYTG